MTDTRRPDPLTAEGDPTWLNPATIKGAVAVAVGLLFLLFPGASVPLIRYGLGGALVFVGASDLWSYLAQHDRTQPRYRLIAAVIAVGAGIGMIAWPVETVRVVEIGFGLYLVLQGINIVIRTINTWEGKPSGFPLLRGLVYIGFGAAMFLVGEFLLSTLLLAGAVLAIVAGLIMVGYGTQARTPEEAAALDSAGILAIVVAWLNERDLGSDKRAAVANTLYFEAPDLVHKLVSYTVMLALSVSIATLAILQDSTAVVIGAMLIAPLMTPIMGTAAAIVNGWRGGWSGPWSSLPSRWPAQSGWPGSLPPGPRHWFRPPATARSRPGFRRPCWIWVSRSQQAPPAPTPPSTIECRRPFPGSLSRLPSFPRSELSG